MIIKKAAMFGLDARIALAIFGALSVISGAALYSAIKTAKAEALRQNFEELHKASEQYYLDNGQSLPQYTSNSNQLTYLPDLITNRENLSTWRGPYIEGTVAADTTIHTSFTQSFDSGASYRIILRTTSDWSEANDFTSDGLCALDDSDCSEWLHLHAGSSDSTDELLQLFDDLDELVDGSDGALSGKVRYNTAYEDYILYQGRMRKRTI